MEAEEEEDEAEEEEAKKGAGVGSSWMAEGSARKTDLALCANAERLRRIGASEGESAGDTVVAGGTGGDRVDGAGADGAANQNPMIQFKL